jgi:hypothetical protein
MSGTSGRAPIVLAVITHVFDTRRVRLVTAGVVTPLVAVCLYWKLAGAAQPALLERFEVSPQSTAGTATAASLYQAEGGFKQSPPDGRADPYTAQVVRWRARGLSDPESSPGSPNTH